jgi:hypothetical protein
MVKKAHRNGLFTRIIWKSNLTRVTFIPKRISATSSCTWNLPSPAKAVGEGQERGNSGVFLQDYEIQVLDSYDNTTFPNGQCGAVFGQSAPLVNACKKPGQWQTYDVIFQAERWNENHQLVSPACVTVLQNGLLIQNKQALQGPTDRQTLAHHGKELCAEGPVSLQDHSCPVRFRNIWIRKIQEQEKP